MTTVRGQDSHPIYCRPKIGGTDYAIHGRTEMPDDERAETERNIKRLADSTDAARLTALAIERAMEPPALNSTSIPFNLEEVQRLMGGFVRYDALDASIYIKLGVAEKRLKDRGFNA